MALLPPITSFHFSVVFLDLGPNLDVGFQSVSGLSGTIETETIAEGGENRFKHQLPTGVTFPNLVLKRSLQISSKVTSWCEDAIEKFIFKPIDLLVVLHNEQHLPLYTWKVIHAIPVSWSVSDFNAETSEFAIETLELKYQYYRSVSANDIPLPF